MNAFARLGSSTLSLLLLLSACSHPAAPKSPSPSESSAWVQADAESGWQVRALTAAAQCPRLQWPGGSAEMQLRAAPATLPARQHKQEPSTPAVFVQRSCEARWPLGVKQLNVGTITLKAPAARIEHLLLIGDSGCRMKAPEAFQDCHDGAQWPFARIAKIAAARQPDLVIHVGDMHYRESPCPPDRADCQDSPWGYGEDVWLADFFKPAAPLLQAAPWVVARGNHESCGRAGLGWFRYLAAGPWSPERSCQEPARDADADFSPPYAVPLDADTQIIVFDSSAAANQPFALGSPAARRYEQMLSQVDALAAQKKHSLFLNHHPVLGFGYKADGRPTPGNASLSALMQAHHPERLYPEGVELVLNGHIHLFEGLGFATPHPVTLVLGNSGSAMEGHVDPAAALQAQPVPGAQVQTFITQPGFGFATLDRQGLGWTLSEWNAEGQLLQRCQIEGHRLSCAAPEPAAQGS